MHPTSRPNAWKWWLTVVLFLGTVLTYLDRQTLSLCAPAITADMHLSGEQYGRLLAAFRWTYALTHVVAGFVADRLSLRGVYAVAVLVWSLAGAGAAFTLRFPQLLLTRQVLGIGEAFNWPCATRIVADMLPPQDRALASGIFNSGSAIGSLVAPFMILPIAQIYGWRAAFVVIGGLGIVWVALWLMVTRRKNALTASVESLDESRVMHATRPNWRVATMLASCRDILLHPAFWMLAIVGLCVNPCWYFLNDWVPKYMHDQRGMSQLSAGMTSVPVFLFGGLGNLAGGALVKYLTFLGWPLRRARGLTVVLAVLLVLPVGGVASVQNATLVVVVLSSAAFGLTAVLANYTACQQDLSFANVGAVVGFLGLACNVFSATANPWIGSYVDRTGSYHVIFVLLGALPLLALVATLVFDWLILGRGALNPDTAA